MAQNHTSWGILSVLWLFEAVPHSVSGNWDVFLLCGLLAMYSALISYLYMRLDK